MPVMSYADAAKLAVAEAMRDDLTVWCVGEDLGRGGVFKQYTGLVEEFGPQRISDAPISEAAIMGAAFGAAMAGTRPIVEMRFADFALCATDELVNQIAKARFMFGGQSRAPMVIRKPMGMWRSSAAQHSQSLESWYTHIPGLVVCCPATPQDNYSMMKAAIACDDPVVYLEHKNIWASEGEVDTNHAVDFGKAALRRSGRHVTLVSWSHTANVCVEAAETLAHQGIEAEVIDLRSLWPWDKAAVFDSVRKTGRLLVAHEAVSVAGFGAEVVATVAQNIPMKALPKRLGSPRGLIAYAPNLEDQMRVTAPMIAKAAQDMMENEPA
ncbi:alpha-ketoacid dehydrogenase subunit beta [Neptunicoccus cionae]|uniref:Pyruvate dehydrogenase subunit beta n=1 Tax=Neptunicoccus cionae TaxID=2035344 RepID=A0A916R108_9RHOB|nr:transketolase C-terminal domain-containing protein [Amylibacter cionae]GGA25909.1 pyruvate dehydrogenase subunit beta [Amylibacter cionae]